LAKIEQIVPPLKTENEVVTGLDGHYFLFSGGYLIQAALTVISNSSVWGRGISRKRRVVRHVE